MRLPRGYPNKWRPGHTRISITLKNSTFRWLLERARKEEMQFSDAIEDTLTCGIMCLEESDLEEVA